MARRIFNSIESTADQAEAMVQQGRWIDAERHYRELIGQTHVINYEYDDWLRRLGEIRSLGRPICVGASRKSFIGKITGRDAHERLGGTIASSVLALANGAEVFRVHDVREVREALAVAEVLLGRRKWARA